MSTTCQCNNCAWHGSRCDLGEINDFWGRVNPGELMPAGECPDCGSLVDLPEADMPDYVLGYLAALLRTRGWTVSGPGTAPAAPVAVVDDVMDATRRFLGRA